VHTINIRILGLCTLFRLLFAEGIISYIPKQNISQVQDMQEVQGIPDEQIDSILSSYDDIQFANGVIKPLYYCYFIQVFE
jgi:hypothetical protein